MPIGETKEKYFISPRKAVQIIGKSTFGPKWRADLPNDDPMTKAALRSLYEALQSGTTKAEYYETGQQPRPLTPAMADDELFTISLKHDGCLFGQAQWPPNFLKINQKSLRSYFSALHKIPEVRTIKDETECEKWLISRFSSDEFISSKAELFQEIKSQFPSLSKRAFDRLRAEAARKCDRTDLIKGGRRKKRPQN